MSSNLSRILVVGASLSGLRLGERLRALGYEGEIVLVGEELHFPPFDRPPMSKGMLSNANQPDGVRLTVASGLDAKILTGVRAEQLMPDLHSVLLSDGSTMEFDGLGVTTGSIPHRLSCPGADLAGVMYLRTVEDSWSLAARFSKRINVVVVGAGFIGCEIAASCRSMGAEVAVVDPLPWPMGRAIGVAAGDFVTRLHRGRGVDVRLGVSVDEVLGEDGAVRAVRLSDGAELPADVVVVGIGSLPCTDWLSDTSLVLHDGLVCEADMAASGASHIVAAGDVARWRHHGYGRQMRVQHWTNAVEQAEHAAGTLLTPLEQRQPYLGVPYFWSDQYESKLQFTGMPATEEAVVEGSLTEGRAVVSYSDGERLTGILCVNWPARLVRRRLELQRQIEEFARSTEPFV